MRKRGPEERGPIGGWLVQSRGRFTSPAGERWTADDFLAELRSESGWAPVRTTYARWESGAARPSDANLARVVAFYAKRGVPGPFDEPKPAEPQADLALRAVLAAERQAAAAELQAALMARQVAALESIAARLSGGQPDPRAVDEARAWGLEQLAALDAARSPRPVQSPGQ